MASEDKGAMREPHEGEWETPRAHVWGEGEGPRRGIWGE